MKFSMLFFILPDYGSSNSMLPNNKTDARIEKTDSIDF
jgi:hypothetical protein